MATVTFGPFDDSTSATTVLYSDVLKHPERYYNGADIAWVMTASALVFIMIPSLSLIYAGMCHRSFALTMFRLPMITAAFVGLQWVLWGYSLTFSTGGLWYGGEKRANALVDTAARPINTGTGPGGRPIPELLYVVYEAMFASFTAALVCGGTMHRVRPARFMLFISIWAVLVYDPVARWSWCAEGWSNQLGVMDFAGGTPVHIVSGSTVAAFAVFYSIESKPSYPLFFSTAWRLFARRTLHVLRVLWYFLESLCIFCTACCFRYGPARDPPVWAPEGGDQVTFQPFNVNYLVLGTGFLWFGWAGFNGGSALGANLRAVSAWLSTHTAACAGGVTGMFWIWLWKLNRDPEPAKSSQQSSEQGDAVTNNERSAYNEHSVLYFCDGAIAGLVAITPAAGYVPVWSAVPFGIIAAVVVNLLKKEATNYLRHDKLQIFAVHAGGGCVGMLLTGIFSDRTTIGLDGHSDYLHPEQSWGRRIGIQIADALAGMLYAFLMTLLILYGMTACAYAVSRCTSRPKSWKEVTGFQNPRFRYEDRHLQATLQQQWSWQLDEITRPQQQRTRPSVDDRGPARVAGSENGVLGAPPRLEVPDLEPGPAPAEQEQDGQCRHIQ